MTLRIRWIWISLNYFILPIVFQCASFKILIILCNRRSFTATSQTSSTRSMLQEPERMRTKCVWIVLKSNRNSYYRNLRRSTRDLRRSITDGGQEVGAKSRWPVSVVRILVVIRRGPSPVHTSSVITWLSLRKRRENVLGSSFRSAKITYTCTRTRTNPSVSRSSGSHCGFCLPLVVVVVIFKSRRKSGGDGVFICWQNASNES